MTVNDFRRIALSFEGAEEGSHMGAADFRVDERIFATLASQAEGYGNLKLTPEQQAEFVREAPDVFIPIKGGWGRMGMTHIVLAKANKDVLEGALRAAWKLRVEQNKSGAKKKGRDGRRVSCTEYRVRSTEYRVPSTEYRVPSTEYRVPRKMLLSGGCWQLGM